MKNHRAGTFHRPWHDSSFIAGLIEDCVQFWAAISNTEPWTDWIVLEMKSRPSAWNEGKSSWAGKGEEKREGKEKKREWKQKMFQSADFGPIRVTSYRGNESRRISCRGMFTRFFHRSVFTHCPRDSFLSPFDLKKSAILLACIHLCGIWSGKKLIRVLEGARYRHVRNNKRRYEFSGSRLRANFEDLAQTFRDRCSSN